MFKYEKNKLALPLHVLGFVLVIVSFAVVNVNADLCVLMLFAGFVVWIISLVLIHQNNKKRRECRQIDIKIAHASNMDVIDRAIAAGRAYKFPNEQLIVTDEAILAVTDTADVYFYRDIEDIFGTQYFGEDYHPEMQFIKLVMKEGTTNYYVAIRQKKNVKESYAECLKTIRENFEAYKALHPDVVMTEDGVMAFWN